MAVAHSYTPSQALTTWKVPIGNVMLTRVPLKIGAVVGVMAKLSKLLWKLPPGKLPFQDPKLRPAVLAIQVPLERATGLRCRPYQSH